MKQIIILIISCLLFTLNINANIAEYIIESKTKLVASNEPENSSFDIIQTGAQKFRMTSGTSTTIHLYGYSNVRIKSVHLSMRSNSASGAGFLQMKVDGNVFWSIPDYSFSDKQWNGEYSTEYVEISRFFDGILNGENIEIYIESTENSIYINSFSIEYEYINTPGVEEPPVIVNHVITFHTNIPDEQDLIYNVPDSSNIIVPVLDYDNGYWQFYAWSEKPIETITSQNIGPVLLDNNVIPLVTEDADYYAVFIHKPEITLTDELTTGNYMLMLSDGTTRMVLFINDNSILFEIENNSTFDNANLIFNLRIETLSDSTLYIKSGSKYLQPDADNKFLKLETSKYVWHYAHKSDNSFYIYTCQLNQRLYIGFYNYKPYLTQESTYNTKYNWQFYQIPDDINLRYYYSYPEGKPTALQITPATDIRIMGDIISNPSCTGIQIYSIGGQIIRTSNLQTISITDLASGLYIIRTDNGSCIKIIK